jgi:hypothetical protein
MAFVWKERKWNSLHLKQLGRMPEEEAMMNLRWPKMDGHDRRRLHHGHCLRPHFVDDAAAAYVPVPIIPAMGKSAAGDRGKELRGTGGDFLVFFLRFCLLALWVLGWKSSKG